MGTTGAHIPLSCCFIVKNEEPYLERLLKQVCLFSDDIVVVDTGSTDNTTDLAHKYGTRVFHFKWCDDFSKARNFSLQQARGEFILWLDADDIIDPKSIAALTNFSSQADLIYTPYHVGVQDDGKAIQTIHRERILRRSSGLRFEFPIHECINPKNHTRIEHRSDIVLYHRKSPDFHDPCPERHHSQRNIQILERHVTEGDEKNNQRLWVCLAQEYLLQDQLEASLKAYETAFQCPATLGSQLLSEAHYDYALALLSANRSQEAYTHLETSSQLYPNWREPYYSAGRILYDDKNFTHALTLFERALSLPRPQNKSIRDEALYSGDILFDYLAITYGSLGQWDQALHFADQALAINPNNPRLRRHRDEFLRYRDNT